VRGGDWESGGNSKRASSAGEEIASAEAAGEKKMAAVETFGVFIGRKRERAVSAGEEASTVAFIGEREGARRRREKKQPWWRRMKILEIQQARVRWDCWA
jgi:hypothetical protein